MRYFALLLALLAGCSDPSATAPATQAATRQALPLPIEITLGQRTTTAVPGTDGRLLITVDDITRDQVMASLATRGGAVLLPTRSMAAGDTAEFTFAETPLTLRLKKLDNSLVGEDSATFEISAGKEALSEARKIERLIESVSALPGATFIRNGAEHTAAEAAAHMRSKLGKAGDQVTTARQFIDEIASKSSISGKPYQIRLADGRTVAAGEFLHEQLRKIEQDR